MEKHHGVEGEALDASNELAHDTEGEDDAHCRECLKVGMVLIDERELLVIELVLRCTNAECVQTDVSGRVRHGELLKGLSQDLGRLDMLVSCCRLLGLLLGRLEGADDEADRFLAGGRVRGVGEVRDLLPVVTDVLDSKAIRDVQKITCTCVR